MDELFTAFAKLLPAEMLIEQLEESIREYRATGSEDAKKRIAMWCSMFAMQVSTEGQASIRRTTSQLYIWTRRHSWVLKKKMNHFSTISPLEAFKQAFPWYEPKVNKENLTYAFGCSRIATKAYRRAIRVIIEKGLPLSVILETTWINEYVFDISMTVFLVPEEYTFADEVQDDEVYQEEKAEWR